MGGGRMMGKVFQCHKTDLDRSSRGVIAGIISKVDIKLSENRNSSCIITWRYGVILNHQGLLLWPHLLDVLGLVEPVEGGV